MFFGKPTLYYTLFETLTFFCTVQNNEVSHLSSFSKKTRAFFSSLFHFYKSSAKLSSGFAFSNLLFLRTKSSLEDGGAFAAIVGAGNAGSLSFNGAFHVTLLASSFLSFIILAMSTGMYLYPFLTFTTLEFHSLVL